MMRGPRLLARVALFSALVYVFSWGTSYLPNVNLIFFIVFTAGFVWGGSAGILVGAVGMGLWTAFNPYGPAMLPIMMAQMLGAAASGLVGAAFRSRYERIQHKAKTALVELIAAAWLCTLFFYLPVNAVDAWLFQPFWPRFVGGLLWMLITLVSNSLIFPLLFGVTRHLYQKECARP